MWILFERLKQCTPLLLLVISIILINMIILNFKAVSVSNPKDSIIKSEKFISEANSMINPYKIVQMIDASRGGPIIIRFVITIPDNIDEASMISNIFEKAKENGFLNGSKLCRGNEGLGIGSIDPTSRTTSLTWTYPDGYCNGA